MSEVFDGTVTVAAAPGGNPVITLNGGTGQAVLGGSSQDGDLVLRDSAGNDRFIFDGQNGTLTIRDSNGQDAVVLDARHGLLDLGASRNEGDLRIRNNAGTFVFRFDANFAVLDIGGAGSEGDIRLYDDAGAVSIHLDGGAGDIKLMGADIAEDFGTSDPVEPGSLVYALGPDQVAVTTTARDKRIIGVASGAGAVHPALLLGSMPGKARVPVAVMGRVYCRADAGYGVIDIGDILTSSATSGHAMRVEQPSTAAGAVLGKSLGRLTTGRGLVPVLLTLG
jgi:hypothetical protein